ncbi:NUDIX domain-containing protein [archaeon]|jgi:bis(5'-nucleosidyl)-tetraphosphatase|nr:NUDIX domain-containing protein [archaeon]MBT4397797.1 NUDIX domain-containing protein [archaeon]MBT4441131.1 NUDIX domain-containing protein [archaeon]
MPQDSSLGIILVNKDKFLLLRRFPGHWSFPKGTLVNPENKEEEARNICEQMEVKSLFYTKDFTEKTEYFFKKLGQTYHKEVNFLIFETSEEKIKLPEGVLGFVWLDYDRAMSRVTFKGEKEVLKLAYEHLKYNK